MVDESENSSLFDLYVEADALLEQVQVEELDSLVSAGSSTASSISSVSTLSCPGGCVYSYTTVSSAS
ncbi:thiocillin family RiPP [Arachnia propionica]|uniref:Thiocillin family RiPP n=1 Tax=Arachnia propionica TaxID=1750 RepID=A0A3P1WP59_9ACTN|nr:thiocillin family RiPP [Arachnia propionica]